jgi:hypothetical protein
MWTRLKGSGNPMGSAACKTRWIAGSMLLATVCLPYVFPQTKSSSPAPPKQPPRFEDYPVPADWHGPPAPVKLTTASERLFRTNLTNAAKEPSNFAGHYRFTFWGCGSNCGAGAVVDLQTGIVYPPPLGAHGNGWDRWIMSPAFFEGSGVDFRPDSRMVIVRGGINYSEHLKSNVPDAYYFLLEGDRFRQILFISGKESGR